MTDPLFTLLLAFAWFGAVNVSLSALTTAIAATIDRARIAEQPVGTGRLLLALKLAPGLVSLAFIFGVFLPAHWRLEPALAQESAGYSIALLAVAGGAILLLTVWRAARDAAATSALVRRWRLVARATPSALGFPIFVVSDRSLVMSLVGVIAPRLFVAEEIETRLTAEELDVSLAHEAAHAGAADNLKRSLAAWCPDALWLVPGGARLASRWRAATEFAADARAVRGSETRAVALASALVKVARLAPSDVPAPMAVSGIHHQALLAARVERLLSGASGSRRPRRLLSVVLLAGCPLALAAVFATMPHPWLAVHQATEGLIRFLP